MMKCQQIAISWFFVGLLVLLVASVSSFSLSPSSKASYERMVQLNASSSANQQEKMTIGKYLLDLHDNKKTFNFCGGMMFQLVLSDALKHHLSNMGNKDVKVYGSEFSRMHSIPNYDQSAFADNVALFHGREIRRVPDASGGMGFVLHLSLANGNDPQGWTENEIKGYDGWGHDVGRDWRTGERLEQEGFTNFRELFGPDSFALHHRFYLHVDRNNDLWLSAEDGCEGTPASTNNPVANLFSNLFK